MEAPDIASLCADLTFADVDDENTSMHLPNVTLDTEADEVGYYAVGRLVTAKNVRFSYFQDTMASIWQPAMGVTMRQLDSKRYLIRFYHEGDLNRVLNDGPWTYEQCLLVMRKLLPPAEPETVQLNEAEFWVQIHSLPVGFRSDVVIKAIGSFLGSWVKSDDKNFDGSMRTFYRIRVTLDITKPLKKQMKLKRDNGEWSVVDFRYERLPTFCFLCGIIGHGDKVCVKALHGIGTSGDKPYGSYLRVGSRRMAPTAGQRWVAPESNTERRSWISPGAEAESAHTPEVSTMTVQGYTTGQGKELQVSPPVPISYRADEVCVNDIVVVDQKRKRMESDAEGSRNPSDMDVESAVSKNGDVAGLAQQARLEL
ncbi:uncharacterized protein LOC116001154 [Ipomoea triloba]|uniref:uncharacterized protein LOC116001154 n=1 Tax=Ipomoea triloba TaxID=35885 RepID=UPI00125D3489|nr:uncharacterized protein LOC116001154 [Ipomoea triloba]